MKRPPRRSLRSSAGVFLYRAGRGSVRAKLQQLGLLLRQSADHVAEFGI